MTDKDKKVVAKKFAEVWATRGDEKQETQVFWLSLLNQIFGIADPTEFIQFEKRALGGAASCRAPTTGFIDAYLPATGVLIEQKSSDIDLRKTQSSGLTPYQQARQYAAALPFSERPRYIVTCNFREFLIYDQEKPTAEPESVLLKDLSKEYYRLAFLVDAQDAHISRELEVSVKAGVIVGKLYDALLKQYANPDSLETLHSLNILCVRLVFCLYAEDAGVFGGHQVFGDYISKFEANYVRRAILDLFKILNTKPEDRDPYLKDENPRLAAFPYVNGGLFARDDIEVPPFTDEIKDLLLKKASEDFDWSQISPTIFGAVFESTLNPETRRKGGMHYTSIENIHKVIDPLFLDDLKAEFEKIRSLSVATTKNKRLREFQLKLGKLKFLDPACGSGNFLTETYISLRRLENDALREMEHGQSLLDLADANPIEVKISQFSGIEINDFAVTVAKTALWIAENQMMKETESIIDISLDFLPLKTNATIVEGNALRMDWGSLTTDCTENTDYGTLARAVGGATNVIAHDPSTVIARNEVTWQSPAHPSQDVGRSQCPYDYIIGNPPFVGGMMMSKEQHQELENVFPECKQVGEVDYVVGWYVKAAKLIKGSNTRCAFVSTNSICQGQSVAAVWKPLMEMGVEIDFAHRTFQWDSEANLKAHVHCVIVGFSCHTDFASPNGAVNKKIFDGDKVVSVQNINGYLLDAENIFLESHAAPLSEVPPMRFGSMPRDGGGFILTDEEREELIKNEPLAEKWIHSYVGANEFINNKSRWCLWLVGANPHELKQCPSVMKRIEFVRDFRASSKAAGTRKFAATPTLFCQIAQPDSDYIIVPQVSCPVL